MENRLWVICVAHNALDNFATARSREIWGHNDKGKLSEINAGDVVLFVANVVWNIAPRNPLDKVREKLSGVGVIVVARASSNVFEDHRSQIWDNDLYPFRFRFKEFDSVENVKPEQIEDAFLDAIRKSAIQSSQAYSLATPPNILEDPITKALEAQQDVSASSESRHEPSSHGAPKYWWVNQGRNYQKEHEEGCLWAGKYASDGRVLEARSNVQDVREGDVILHYSQGALQATSHALGSGQEVQNADGETGFRAEVEYKDLISPIPLEDIPIQWRQEEGGPFNKSGGVKQAYLFPLSKKFADRLLLHLHSGDLLPTSSLESDTPSVWLFQANPKYWPLAEKLKQWQEGDEDTWSVTRYREEMKIGDTVLLWQSGSEAGIYAVGTITSDPFEKEPGEHLIAQGKTDTTEIAVRYRITKILECPIPKDFLKTDPVLSNLQVIKSPQGTNYRVAQTHWGLIKGLIDRMENDSTSYTQPDFASIEAAVKAGGMEIDARTLRRYHLALNSRKFVILAGVSGTGKTWLTKAYADAVGAQHCLVPVAPNWLSNEDLLGYDNPLHKEYRDTVFSRFLRRAATEYQQRGENARPYHLALDEMNLARVEYYFAKFLSAMEVRSRGDTALVELGSDEVLELPPNLYVIGTVNVDETTHGFSDKVYDRAQLIELPVDRPQLLAHMEGHRYQDLLIQIWDEVHTVAPFAYRVIDDVRHYVTHAEELGVSWRDALDEQLTQKILPKMKGAEQDVGDALAGFITIAEREKLELSLSKAQVMYRKLQLHGFTSYF